jgi:hypothetical protein
MVGLFEICKYLEKTLGKEALNVFSINLEDTLYGIRSWALIDVKTEIATVKLRIKKMAINLVMESIKVYLEKNFEKNWNVKEDELFDGEMKKIPAVESIKAQQALIIDALEQLLIQEFMLGREIAEDVIDRAQSCAETRSLYSSPARNYKECPPLEQIEAEIIHLEGKLPNLSLSEAQKLRELYEKCAGKL